MLVNYFGEEARNRCGVCDVCLQRNKIGVSDLEFDTISDRIRLLLLKGEFSLDELMSKVEDHHESQALKVIEWMIDNSKIKYVRGNLLEWVENSN